MANILHFDDWQVTNVQTTNQALVVEAVYGPAPEACPKCGVVGSFYKHGKKQVTFRDAPIRGKPVLIQCDRQRYRCQECKETFFQPLPEIDDHRDMTKRLIEYVGEQALKKPFTQIADEAGLDEKTVRQIAGRAMEQMESPYPTFAPHVLGMDEVMVAGELRAIFTDLASPMVLEELAIYCDKPADQITRADLPKSGPCILNEQTAFPWSANEFRRKWRIVADAVGIPKEVRNADSRAGAITEATEAGAELEHVKHAAAHSDIGQTQRYSRGGAKKVVNVQLARIGGRTKAAG